MLKDDKFFPSLILGLQSSFFQIKEKTLLVDNINTNIPKNEAFF
jgi:hypothetical protein